MPLEARAEIDYDVLVHRFIQQVKIELLNWKNARVGSTTGTRDPEPTASAASDAVSAVRITLIDKGA